jgi:zinc protease
MDSPDAIANAVSLYIWVTGNAESINKSYKLFDTVTPGDIQRVAKKYLVKNGLTISTISPDEKPILN